MGYTQHAGLGATLFENQPLLVSKFGAKRKALQSKAFFKADAAVPSPLPRRLQGT